MWRDEQRCSESVSDGWLSCSMQTAAAARRRLLEWKLEPSVTRNSLVTATTAEPKNPARFHNMWSK